MRPCPRLAIASERSLYFISIVTGIRVFDVAWTTSTIKSQKVGSYSWMTTITMVVEACSRLEVRDAGARSSSEHGVPNVHANRRRESSGRKDGGSAGASARA